MRSFPYGEEFWSKVHRTEYRQSITKPFEEFYWDKHGNRIYPPSLLAPKLSEFTTVSSFQDREEWVKNAVDRALQGLDPLKSNAWTEEQLKEFRERINHEMQGRIMDEVAHDALFGRSGEPGFQNPYGRSPADV